MTAATLVEKKSSTQQAEKKKKQAEPLLLPEREQANPQTQKSGTSKGSSGQSSGNASGSDGIPAVHGSDPAYAQGSELMYKQLQKSSQQTGDLNHPDTQKSEMNYKMTLSVKELMEYQDLKPGRDVAKSTAEQSITAQEAQNKAASQGESVAKTQPITEIIPQSGGNGQFQTPVVYRNKGFYTVDFNANQTDYDGSPIIGEAQFKQFIIRVLNESNVVLPNDKPSGIDLTNGFSANTIAVLKAGSTMTYWPSPGTDKKTGDDTGDGTQGATTGQENGTAEPKKSAEELQKEFDAFPQSVKDLLRISEDGRLVTLEEKLALAQYIFDNLTVLEMLDYASKTSASTMSFAEFKASIQQYKKDKAEREAEGKERAALEKQLTTASFKELYELYKEFAKSVDVSSTSTALSSSSTSSSDLGTSLATTLIMTDKMGELTEALEKAGYKGGITEFEKLLRRYEAAFEREAVHTAIAQLQQYKHILFEEKNKLEDAAYLQRLLNQVKGSGAGPLYESGKSDQAGAVRTRRNGEASETTVDYQKMDRGQEKINKADSLVNTIPNDLVKEKQFDKSGLAAITDTASLKEFLKKYIEKKEASITDISETIIKNPEAIYKMDLLYDTCKQAQGIAKGSILDEILADKKAKLKQFDFIKNLIIAFGAILLTIASAGTGTLALVALGANFALSAYTVYETIETYKTEKDGYNTGLLSDDPSLLWVIIAIAGAAVDAAALKNAFKLAEPLAAATKEFNAGKEVLLLEQKLAAIKGLDPKIEANIMKQARLDARYKEVMKGFAEIKTLANVSIPGLVQTGELLTHLIFAVRKGIVTFEGVLLELKAARLIEDLGKLSKDDISLLEKALAKAKTLAKDEKLAADLEKALSEKDLARIKALLDEHAPVQQIDNKFPHEVPDVGELKNWTVKDGLIVGPKGDPIHSPSPQNFIIDMQGNIKIGEKHAFLASNESVQAAGSIIIKGGKVRLVDNLSGHYKPTLEEAMHFKEAFQKAGLKTDGALQQIYKIEQNAAGEVTKETVIKTIRW